MYGGRRSTVSQYAPVPARYELHFTSFPQLLDDDREVIGTLYQDHICLEGELSPASRPGAGHDYLELHNIPSDELVEILGTPRSLLARKRA